MIPTSNEATWLGPCIRALHDSATQASAGLEVVVVDAGSRDQTVGIARDLGARVIASPRSQKAHQLNLGAWATTAPMLWFLHADTVVPPEAVGALLNCGAQAGWFHVRLLPTAPSSLGVAAGLWVIAWGINRRTDLFVTATGDQGLFLTRQAWERCGPFPEQPLLECWEMTRALKRAGLDICILRPKLGISARRWERGGLGHTTLKMHAVRAAYIAGISPGRLARWWGRP